MKKIYDYEEFRDYIKEQKQNKPFNCPLLGVMPEKIKYHNDEYEKGALLCSEKPGNQEDGNVRCSLLEMGIIFNERGNIEGECGWTGNKFELKIMGFKKINKR